MPELVEVKATILIQIRHAIWLKEANSNDVQVKRLGNIIQWQDGHKSNKAVLIIFKQMFLHIGI